MAVSGHAPGFAERASGLLVPAATLDKQRYTLPESDFVKLRRLMKFAREYGLIAMYFCEVCKQPVKLEQHDRLVTDAGPEKTNAKGGRFTLACDCSHWTIR